MSKLDKIAAILVLLGLILIMLGIYVWVPFFIAGVVMLIIGAILWNPFDLLDLF